MITIFIIFSLLQFLTGAPIDTAVNELNQLMKTPFDKNKNDNKSSLTLTLENAEFVSSWPSVKLMEYLGQVSGLSFCPKGFLYIFHRADVEMNERSFDRKNLYTKIEEGPIKESTILKLNNRIDEPTVVAEFGSNLFYLPHGMFANKDYMVATDLARHQVLRIPHNTNEPDLILGEKFIPGNDQAHFCKPTHAVIAKDGSIFVADGYCNSRVIKFDKFGKYQLQFGDEKDERRLSIPHHLALIESKDLICVADRENMRVQCYGAGIKDKNTSGKLVKTISDERFGPIYAIGYNELNNMLYIVSGMMNERDKSRVYIYDMKLNMVTGAVDFSGPNGFGMIHTLDVCPRGHCLALGGLTKECLYDSVTCLEREGGDEDSQLRNIWLFRLFDEKLKLE